MESSWQVALIQSHIRLGEPNHNCNKIRRKMEQALQGERKPDLLLLPELWNTGYALTQIKELADQNGHESRAWLSEFASKHQINIVAGSIAERKEDGKIYNTMMIFDKTGKEIGSYSKIHLFRLMDEHHYLAAGDQSLVTDIAGVPVGAVICYDIRFPEFIRSLALQGAKVLFVSAQWPHARLHHWRTLIMARAIENQMFVVACNRSGTSGEEYFAGHSMIVDPWGNVLAEGNEEEQIVTASLDLSLTDKVRDSIPVFEDRRADLY